MALLGNGVPESLGVRLRNRREEAGLSVRKLGRAVGVSPSLVSQIENGKANPSVGSLFAIVSTLGISLDELFEPDGSGSRTKRSSARESSEGPVLRATARPTLRLSTGVRWERLTPMAEPNLEFLHVTYEVGGASCPPDALMRHSGRDYGLVLKGRLGATIGFDNYELEPGDSFVFDASTPHRLWTIGDEPCILLAIVVGRSGNGHVSFGPDPSASPRAATGAQRHRHVGPVA